MAYQTLLVEEIQRGIMVTINRLPQRNALNTTLMLELHQVLDEAERSSDCRIIILKGQQGVFCTGMDFDEITQSLNTEQGLKDTPHAAFYMKLLKRFTSTPKIIISIVDGQVMAGGVGLVAASDLVIATNKAQFSLSEALWGLLPANVLPYLIKRIGFQKSYLMTLTTETMNAIDAHRIGLVDELSDQPEEVLRKHLLRLFRLDTKTIQDLKSYFRKLWIINEEMEQTAMNELVRLMQEPIVQTNIKNFIEHGTFPWESKS